MNGEHRPSGADQNYDAFRDPPPFLTPAMLRTSQVFATPSNQNRESAAPINVGFPVRNACELAEILGSKRWKTVDQDATSSAIVTPMTITVLNTDAGMQAVLDAAAEDRPDRVRETKTGRAQHRSTSGSRSEMPVNSPKSSDRSAGKLLTKTRRRLLSSRP